MDNKTFSGERDFPQGHPAAVDYHGEKYTPRRAPWSEDYPPDHPARGGKNASTLDSPDGQRKAQLQFEQSKQTSEAGGHEPEGQTGGNF